MTRLKKRSLRITVEEPDIDENLREWVRYITGERVFKLVLQKLVVSRDGHTECSKSGRKGEIRMTSLMRGI